MEKIQHKFVQNQQGLKLHVAEIGTGSKVILFLHGFPEIWYSWRYQMIAVANAGYRAIAPDYRGYGLSDHGPEPEKTTFSDLVSDLIAILDSLEISKVFLVGKDFAIRPLCLMALLHPERVKGVITLGVPLVPFTTFARDDQLPVTRDDQLPEGFYIARWRVPGRAEADFGRFDAKTVVRKVYILFSKSEIPIAAEGQEVMDMIDPSTPLPSWFTEDDLAAYGDLYEKSGFKTALKVPYRAYPENYDLKDVQVKVPALLIMGNEDYFLKFPGVEEYINTGAVKQIAPDLEIIFVPEGSHFIQEQFPDQVNELILAFLSKHHC